ncbi:MAG: S8 family serine peptidase [Trueperaceae bacterium]|nr:S8 family serine peptidase [Trueperaceae bacterium]
MIGLRFPGRLSRKSIWPVVATLALVLAACTPPDSTPPTVAITAPAANAVVTAGTTVHVTGTSDDNVRVAGVTVLVNGEALNTVVPSDTGDWALDWVPTTEGAVQLVARAKDTGGNPADSAAVSVTISGATGSVVGTITRAPTTFSLGAQAAGPEAAPVVPGELFVTFERGARDARFGTTAQGAAEGFTFRADGGFAFGGTSFAAVTTFPLVEGLTLYRAAGLDAAATRAMAERLSATGLVRSAFPNWILSTTALTPDDPLYAGQAWHYELLNLPEAWEVETGATDKVTVAVLDTGKYDHADVQWAAGGANFANWDPVAQMPGEGTIDDPYTLAGGSTHGTHVAGTIGAVTDNAVGVAGVNWNVDVLPVKVLGANGSGNFAGILEGLFWAAGVDDPAYGGHVNANIPRVINMSLGGNVFAACPADADAIFGALASMGITTVVSAGNDGSAADIFFPASCPSVITVGAAGPTGARAYYSNYGLQVDVLAPGGDDDYAHPDLPGDYAYAGVLSTVSDGVIEDYGLMEGTSMAAPHVSGVVSLMLAREPGLSTAQIRARLHAASAPLALAECAAPVQGLADFNLCGAGLLDANAALLGLTLASSPTATVYALPYVNGVAPDPGFGSLPSLGELAPYQTAAVPLGDGTYTYTLDGLAPGTYLVLSIETRDAATGISGVDRVAVVDEVEVTAGAATDVDLTGVPLYTFY